jgi:hypothetical protein
MKYDINVLDKMVKTYDAILKVFTEDLRTAAKDGTQTKHLETAIATASGNRSLVASFIANGGISTVPAEYCNGSVSFDIQMYRGILNGKP